MLTIKHNNWLCRGLRNYLNKQSRINYDLQQLVQHLKKEDNLSYLSTFVEHPLPVPHAFKMLILINRMINSYHTEDGRISEVIIKLKWYADGDLEEVIGEKLLKSYQLFLQKRAISGQLWDSSSSEQNQIKVYRLINLLRLGTSFANMIFTLGRYYLREWIVEFNIALCMDLRVLYTRLVEILPLPIPSPLLYEIEVIHEKMYVVFYNCYFHKQLKVLVPQWIKTDLPDLTPKEQSALSTSAKTKSFESSPSKIKQTIESQKMLNFSMEEDSCMQLNDKLSELENISIAEDLFQQSERLDTQERRGELIKSMERIVSMINF